MSWAVSAIGSSDSVRPAASAALKGTAPSIRHGGTITHHHAVGRDHRSGYEKEVDPLFRRMLQAAKHSVDPQGILNPGVLFDPLNRPLGITGALAR